VAPGAAWIMIARRWPMAVLTPLVHGLDETLSPERDEPGPDLANHVDLLASGRLTATVT
jgi:hypothetical protein